MGHGRSSDVIGSSEEGTETGRRRGACWWRLGGRDSIVGGGENYSSFKT